MAANVSDLEAALDFQFERRELLLRALTHSSHVHEAGLARHPHSDNEQLEFLGDAVLGFVVAEHLVSKCPDFDEGRLSSVRARLVNRSHLADVARTLELGRYLVMGRGEELSGGRSKASLLVNALEALLGAMYQQGGLDPVRRVVAERVIANADFSQMVVSTEINAKAALEELARARGWALPVYEIFSEGPANALRFSAAVRLGGVAASGSATSKKAAQQAAARDFLLKQSVTS